MTVTCPDPECSGTLQEPFVIPGTTRTHHAFCELCDQQYPEKDTEFAGVADPSENGGPPLEREVRWDCNSLWEVIGFHVYDLEQGFRLDRGGSRQTPGIADTYLVGHGLRVWIEYKRPDNRQNDAQELFEERVKAHDGLYYVVRSTQDVEAVLQELKGHPDWQERVKPEL